MANVRTGCLFTSSIAPSSKWRALVIGRPIRAAYVLIGSQALTNENGTESESWAGAPKILRPRKDWPRSLHASHRIAWHVRKAKITNRARPQTPGNRRRSLLPMLGMHSLLGLARSFATFCPTRQTP
jgi:hypothetical protein